MRAVGGDISKCITCVELIKDETFKKPPTIVPHMQTLWQWNKIGEARCPAADTLALDTYIPIIEILVSRSPLGAQYTSERLFYPAYLGISCLLLQYSSVNNR